MAETTKYTRRMRRKGRIRAKVSGDANRPRLAVFRSNKHFYVQLIDDQKGRVIASSSDLGRAVRKREEMVKEIGKDIAEKAKAHKVSAIVFDRSGYKYHGQIKTLAQELRAQGIQF